MAKYKLIKKVNPQKRQEPGKWYATPKARPALGQGDDVRRHRQHHYCSHRDGGLAGASGQVRAPTTPAGTHGEDTGLGYFSPHLQERWRGRY